MSFDPKSLERLRQLGRTLPKPLPIEKKLSTSNKKRNSKLHPIETEQDPQKLFKELIKASKNGEVPSHLIDRLRSLEKEDLKDKPNLINKLPSTSEENDLYVDFHQLLLEEEGD